MSLPFNLADHVLTGHALPEDSAHPLAESGAPARKAVAQGPVDPHLVSLVSRDSYEAEQYRVLRHLLEKLHRGPKLTVVGVTSAGVGDGKTTTAINIAGALAQNREARVLLVDGDLRRPSVGPSLGLGSSNGPGLARVVLRSDWNLGPAVRWLPEFNLAVLPANGSPASVYEVLSSPRMGTLLARARELYDHVVIDMPPVLLVPDCRVISQWVDAFLLVVRAHRTPRKLVAETLNVMGPTKLLGVVFNADDGPVSSYYKQYYLSDRGRKPTAEWSRPSGRRGPQPARESIHATAGLGHSR